MNFSLNLNSAAMKKLTAILFLFTAALLTVPAQNKVDSIQFFIDEKPLTVTIASDFKKLFNTKKETPFQEATVTMIFPDNPAPLTEQIQIRARGNFRKTNCYMPSLMLDFHNQTSPGFYQLDKLKMVSGCGTTARDEQLVLREYLAYKMFNIVSPLSFRVRLMRVSFEDTKGKIKKYTTWGFFIEDVDMMAKRNKYKEYETPTEQRRTEPARMTLVSIFQYLIGNTDWSVPNFHNIKLLKPKADSLAAPAVVPYDFDFAGMVDAAYAAPAEIMGTESVKQRVYRGFSRPLEEVMSVITLLQDKKEAFYKLINEFELLSVSARKDIIKYLDEFYQTVSNKRQVENIFVENTRTN
jgi:hypothetical protein